MKTSLLTVLIFLGISFEFAAAQQKLKSAKSVKVDNAFEKGVIQHGYKTGNWQYFDRPGTLSLTVDYTAGKILFQKKDTVGLYAIEKSGVWTQSNLNVQPRYIGSMSEFYRILMKNIRYPYQARNKSTVGTVYVTFDVDTNGKAANYNIVKNIGDNCAEEVIRVLQLVPNLWTVASKDGELYKSRFMIPVTFKLAGSETEKGKPDAQFPLATLLEEVVISIHAFRRN